MKCEYWWINYHVKHELGKPTPIKHCENEDVKELIEARDERHKRWEEKQRNKVVDNKK